MSKNNVKTYGLGELAQMYNPQLTNAAARKKLYVWMNRHPTLMSDLRKTGYEDKQRTFTPLQVSLIFDALGEP